MQYNDPGLIDQLLMQEIKTYVPDREMGADSEGQLWSTVCGTATVSYNGLNTEFMQIDTEDYSLNYAPTTIDHIGIFPIVVT